MTLQELFDHCLHATYRHVEEGGDYAIEREGDTLCIYLEHSNGTEDWKNNLDFPIKAYQRVGKTVWYAHRGFVRVFHALIPYLDTAIRDPRVARAVTVGYSHGAALSVLCHEYIWYNRPDLRGRIEGYGFGCPRVLWGTLDGDLAARWQGFLVIRNLPDAVTYLPPRFLGYTHVGEILEIGRGAGYTPWDAHRPENIQKELKKANI